ncbi:MAG: alpha-1,2-fucosyltransferase [Bacteroidaceae bacterium]
MRLIKMAGGLGNQMFIYAMYLGMHKRFGDGVRIDITDMLHLHPHNGYELHSVFDLPPCEFHTHRILKKILEGTLFRIILERHQHGSMRAYRERMCWPFVYYKGFYQNERYFADVEQEVRRAFTFNTEKASRQSRLLMERLQADPYAVSVHVRRGDYVSPRYWHSMGRYVGAAYFQRAIERMRSLIPEAHFYVFSDDLPWVRSHLPLATANFVDWNVGKDSWQDMMLMSVCHHHIISNSTFSWWAAWLNPRTDKVVMTPRQWDSTHMALEIIPASWITIDNQPSES